MSNDQGLSTQQILGAIFETETAAMLIDEGLIALSREIKEPHRLNLPFMLLAQGFERLLKLVLLLGQLHVQNELMDSRALRQKFSHHLIKLKLAVEDLMQSSGYSSKSEALRSDARFLYSSQDLMVLLEVLEDYAVRGRYHDLEITVGGKAGADLHGLVDRIQSQFIEKRPDIAAAIEAREDPSLDVFHKELLTDLTETTQRFARALSRTYTLGLLGEIGLQASAPVRHFLVLRDEQLGCPR